MGLRMFKSLAKFGIVFLVMTVVCTVIWDEIINERLYDCTDPIGLGYLHPWDWVHGEIVFVPHVVHDRMMTDPDTIKEGWSVGRLWCVWFAFFGASVAVSVLLARKEWMR